MTDQPWRTRGGVVAVRVASRAELPTTTVALSRAVRAADEDGAVKVLPLAASELELGIRPAVARALQLPNSLGRIDMTRLINEELLRPHLFVAEPPEAASLANCFDDAAGFCDEVVRVSPGSTATIVLLETRDRPIAGDSMDLSVGGPADGLLSLLDGPESELWRAYVYARLAWEIAGDLARAEATDTLDFAGLEVGNDNGLEALLNQLAAQIFSGLSRDAVQLSEKFLAGTDTRPGGPNGGSRCGSHRQMEGCGLFWRPAGEPLPRPAPWWARAMLCCENPDTLRYLLRICLVCAPIAREVLVRCFDLEALDRAYSSPHPRINDDELCRKFEMFRLALPESESRYYPAGCPAVPHGPTDFATYGQILAFVSSDARVAARHRLRRLRNAVAHGHYISWATITELGRVASYLS
jgi:hypothetical protein